jgi:hypothetical protein
MIEARPGAMLVKPSQVIELQGRRGGEPPNDDELTALLPKGEPVPPAEVLNVQAHGLHHSGAASRDQQASVAALGHPSKHQ